MEKTETLYKIATGEYATPKKENRSAKAIPAATIDEIEAGRVTSEQLETIARDFPIFKYKTCVTIHGQFPEITRQRIGYYKNVIQNENKSLAIRYSAIDEEKREAIREYLKAVESPLKYYANSSRAAFILLRSVKAETIQATRDEFAAIADRVKAAEFWGAVEINLYRTVWGGLVLQLEIEIKAILATEVLTVAGAMTDKTPDQLYAAHQKYKAAQEADDATRQAEAAELTKKRQEAQQNDTHNKAAHEQQLQAKLMPVSREYLKTGVPIIAATAAGYVLYRSIAAKPFGRIEYQFQYVAEIPTAAELQSAPWKNGKKSKLPDEIGPTGAQFYRLTEAPAARETAKPKPSPAPQPTPGPPSTDDPRETVKQLAQRLIKDHPAAARKIEKSLQWQTEQYETTIQHHTSKGKTAQEAAGKWTQAAAAALQAKVR